MISVQLDNFKLPADGERILFIHDLHSIIIFNFNGEFYAVADECPHAGASLCTGRVSGAVITCPAHGLRFDVRTGEMPGNSELRLQRYRIYKNGDFYFLDIPDNIV